ncbi:hypothetical protein HBB16_01700 [Pseudonocardia sp. MCCB 268]|nr:hypothetical protein [Pseudonocardia cytotoxica]
MNISAHSTIPGTIAVPARPPYRDARTRGGSCRPAVGPVAARLTGASAQNARGCPLRTACCAVPLPPGSAAAGACAVDVPGDHTCVPDPGRTFDAKVLEALGTRSSTRWGPSWPMWTWLSTTCAVDRTSPDEVGAGVLADVGVRRWRTWCRPGSTPPWAADPGLGSCSPAPARGARPQRRGPCRLVHEVLVEQVAEYPTSSPDAVDGG